MSTPPDTRQGLSGRVRTYRGFFTALDRLEHRVAQQETVRRRLKLRFWALGLVTLVGLGTLVGANFTSTNTTWYAISGATDTYDTTKFSVTMGGQSLAAVTLAAAGTTNSHAGSVEMLLASAGVANTALTAGQWTYTATLVEAGINTFAQSASAYYKVELFLDGTSKGAVYLKNAAGDALNTEGAVIKWDLGTTLPSTGAYVVKVTQVAS